MVLVIGAGPAGLVISKCLKELELRYELIDRYGEAGGSYNRMYSHMQLSSPPSYLELPGAANLSSAAYLRPPEYASYLKEYARGNHIDVIRRTVMKVEPIGPHFTVTFAEMAQPTTYQSLVVCTGSFDYPSIPVVPGLNDGLQPNGIAFCHARNWPGPEQFKNSRLLIVGGGMTAIEIAEECVRHSIKPLMSFRPGRGKTFPEQLFGLDPRFITYPIMRRIPSRVLKRPCTEGWAYRGINRGFKGFCKEQMIDLHPRLESAHGRVVRFAGGSSAEVDQVVFATGYRWDVPFLPSSTAVATLGNPILIRGQSITWPGVFFVGMTCAFTASSHFIHGMCDDAKSVAKMILNRHRSHLLRA